MMKYIYYSVHCVPGVRTKVLNSLEFLFLYFLLIVFRNVGYLEENPFQVCLFLTVCLSGFRYPKYKKS